MNETIKTIDFDKDFFDAVNRLVAKVQVMYGTRPAKSCFPFLIKFPRQKKFYRQLDQVRSIVASCNLNVKSLLSRLEAIVETNQNSENEEYTEEYKGILEDIYQRVVDAKRALKKLIAKLKFLLKASIQFNDREHLFKKLIVTRFKNLNDFSGCEEVDVVNSFKVIYSSIFQFFCNVIYSNLRNDRSIRYSYC